jgi:uncharacterized protein (UPF0332 family)
MPPLHVDLLKQAYELLLGKARNHTTQADLRRAVSTAYYALFHLLIWEAVNVLLGTSAPGGTEEKGLRLPGVLARTFEHKHMNDAAAAFGQPYLPEKLGHGPPPLGGRRGRKTASRPVLAIPARETPTDLRTVAIGFVALQQARHNADYNLLLQYTHEQTADFVDQAQQAFEAWRRVRHAPEAREFLLALAFWDRLRGPKQQR